MNQRRDRIQVQIAGQVFSVVGGEFRQMLAAVKALPGRRFDGNSKVWQLPGTVADITRQVEAAGFQLEGGAPAPEPGPASPPAAPRPGGDRIRVQWQGHPLLVTGGEFREMLAVVKALPERRFDGESKVWEISGALATVKAQIEAAGFQLEGADKILAKAPPAEMEVPDFGPVDAPPPFEEPDFLWDDNVPDYEPPDWWDDESAAPPVEPPDWFEEELAARPPEPPPDFAPPPAAAAPQKPESSAGRRDQIRVRVGGIPFFVVGGEFRQMLAAIKNVPGRRFDGQDKVWD
ncbi:MAG: hypothetical protein D6768_03100, partial [Chloroflexi bacterium]